MKVSFDFTKRITGGLEYYGSYGPITGFDPLAEEQQQFFPSIDLDLGPQWEFNFGVGVGATRSTDHLQIGRASCRGREEIGVVGGSLRKRKVILSGGR